MLLLLNYFLDLCSFHCQSKIYLLIDILIQVCLKVRFLFVLCFASIRIPHLLLNAKSNWQAICHLCPVVMAFAKGKWKETSVGIFQKVTIIPNPVSKISNIDPNTL